MTDDPIIAPSALKHGLTEGEIVHAYRNPVRVWGPRRRVHDDRRTEHAAIFLEVGYIDGETAVVIVHPMHAREMFLR